jgi:TRAP-type C4-dicarboxylate transport system permease small subunit
MSEPDDFDALLAERFRREHQYIAEEPFVAAALQRIRFEQRLAARIRTVLRVAVLLAAVIASPWLIEGATRLNAAVASSLSWTTGIPGAWLLGAAAIAAVLISRVRSR